MKQYKMRIIPLTGIHIGTGSSIDPSEYKIIESVQGNKLYIRFSADSILDSLTEKGKKELLGILERNNYTEVRNYISEKANMDNMLYGSHITRNFGTLYSACVKNPNNQLAVAETYRPPNKKRPMIPGSSLKGAIRTALLNHFVQSASGGPAIFRNSTAGIFGRKSDSRFQQAVLKFSDAKNDPFRAVKISDASVTGKKIMIVGEMVNFSQKKYTIEMEPKGMQIFAEVIRGKLLDGDAEAETILSIDDFLQNVNPILEKKWPGIRTKFKADDLLRSCNDFYKHAWEDECKKFYQCSDDLIALGNELSEIISEIDFKNGECLIRLGRFSQVECVTVNDLRKPGDKKGYGGSRTVFKYDNKLIPLGWTKIQLKDQKLDSAISEKKENKYFLKKRITFSRIQGGS